MLCVGTDVSIVCAEGVTDAKERQRLLASLKSHQAVSLPYLLPHLFLDQCHLVGRPGCVYLAVHACYCQSALIAVHGLHWMYRKDWLSSYGDRYTLQGILICACF